MEFRSKAERVDPRAWARAGAEPSLDELLADPVVRLVMACDAVTADDVRAIIRAVDLGRVRSHRAAGVLAYAGRSDKPALPACRR